MGIMDESQQCIAGSECTIEIAQDNLSHGQNGRLMGEEDRCEWLMYVII